MCRLCRGGGVETRKWSKTVPFCGNLTAGNLALNQEEKVLRAVSTPPGAASRTPQSIPARTQRFVLNPEGNPRANLESISHKCCLLEVAFERDLTEETIHLPKVAFRVEGVLNVYQKRSV